MRVNNSPSLHGPILLASFRRRLPKFKPHAALWYLFFATKICNKYTNINGGTKEFRKV